MGSPHPPWPPRVLMLDESSRWLRFSDPVAVLTADRIGDVSGVLAEVDSAVAAGSWAAGFIAYEAAPAFDPALEAHPAGALPLLWWGLFRPPRETPAPTAGHPIDLDWRPAVSRRRYGEAVAHIRSRIAAGDTYQVNYTFPLEARLPPGVDPAALFAALYRAQRGRYSAYLDTGRFAVCSASPELFFAVSGDDVVARPMKGTARRGRYPAEDDRQAAALRHSPKDRAENVMIVDMMRNDLGRIARPGSVRVRELCALETFPTVHQLTSTVVARTAAPVSEILRALFPCASITGAPKISTARIIRRLEAAPRGVYTGAVGFLAPATATSPRRAQWNVAIRTAVVDRQTGVARYGTGGGIVWDSEAESEYQECRTKALILTSAPPPFALLETLLWRPGSYFLLARHLERLAASGRYFGYPVDRDEVLRRLSRLAESFASDHRVRLLVHRSGRIEVTGEPLPPGTPDGETWIACLDDRPTDSGNRFLFHKTTHRRVYDEARRRFPEVDEVVLWNERGELTEATRANLALKIDGRWRTPPVDSGLLAGTYRAELLERGRLQEEVLPVAAFAAAEEIALLNSVRGWIAVRRRGAKAGDRPARASSG